MISKLTTGTSVEIQHLVMGSYMADEDIEQWVAEDAPFERTRIERWTALSIEEQDTLLEQADEEYAARWDAGAFNV